MYSDVVPCLYNDFQEVKKRMNHIMIDQSSLFAWPWKLKGPFGE